MIINGRQFKITAMSPMVDLGITWESAGGIMHPVDYGAQTTHVSSLVTVSGTPADLEAQRLFLSTLDGSYVGFQLEPGEYVWGPGFDYATAEASNYGCGISDVGDITNSQGAQCSLSFRMRAITPMSNAVFSYSPFPPADKMWIESYKSSRDRSTLAYNTMAGIATSAFVWEAPSTVVTYVMQRVHADHFMAYLFKNRSDYFTLAHAADVFGDAQISHVVYSVGFPSATMIDVGGNYYRIQATYAQRMT